MPDPIASKKPTTKRHDAPPETHKQTAPVEKKIAPADNTTEPYGSSDKDATRKTEP